MNILTIREDMTVDSATIAKECGVEHRAALQLLKTHQAKIEAKFGRVAFQMLPLETSGGTQHRRVARLTEDQSTVFITLFANTDKVVDFKIALTAAFSEAKRRLAGSGRATPEQINEYVLRQYFRLTRPAHDFGTQAKDGRYRVGYRGPTFTVSACRVDDAAMVAADRLHLDDSQMMLFSEESK